MGIQTFVGGPVIVRDHNQIVIVRYTNWRGDTAVRRVLPERFYFGSTEHHKEPQWLMQCTDMDKGETRHFAMSGITEWGPEPATTTTQA